MFSVNPDSFRRDDIFGWLTESTSEAGTNEFRRPASLGAIFVESQIFIRESYDASCAIAGTQIFYVWMNLVEFQSDLGSISTFRLDPEAPNSRFF